MKKAFITIAVALLALTGRADDAADKAVDVVEYAGKAIYIPQDLREMDLSDPASKWSFRRMACTENVALFWAKGFGDNLAQAPDLDGHSMKVDLPNLLDKLETFYRYFNGPMAWTRPGSKAEKYKMMVMLDYSLEGTAYGGDYDGQIGALWIAPNRVQDKPLNCIAHELGHSFQLQISCDDQGEAWGGAGIFEMASQWMLWQVNPDWQTDENYHLEAYRDLTHKAFLHIDNIYHSPYVLEIWGEKHGLPFIAEMFRQGRRGEDPVMTYKRMTGMTQEQFNDEMLEIQRRFINWDIDRVRDHSRQYANRWHTPMVKGADGRLRPSAEKCPENYGFNAIELTVPAPGTKISVDFRGEAGKKGYVNAGRDKAGWRYCLVAVDNRGDASYTPIMRDSKGRLDYTVAEGEPLDHLWLVVMGAPTEHIPNIDGPDNPGDPQWPYSVKLKNVALK